MAGYRGKASPNAHTQRRLFAASAGYCQNPSCSNELFFDVAEESIHIAEMAHVFAANEGGPRAKSDLDAEERGAFDNLILLCSSCHTKVDKAPEFFTDVMILGWKRQHARKLQELFGVTKLNDRSSARRIVEPLLNENFLIFKQYGPHIEAAQNPESGAAERWRRKMLTRILPNNRKSLAICDANRHLLNSDEAESLERFRQHVDDLEAFHIEGFQEDASQFPKELHDIFKD